MDTEKKFVDRTTSLREARDKLEDMGEPILNATRTLVLDAFATLRRQGFLARANFLCCSSCAGAALGEQAEKRIKAGLEFKGLMYWHAQDEECYHRRGIINIGFSNYSLDGAEHGLPTEQIGQAIVMELVKRGVRIEWDGTRHQKITFFGK